MNLADLPIRFVKLPSDPEDASDGAVMNALAFPATERRPFTAKAVRVIATLGAE